MKQLNLMCPINKLGYGTVGRNLIPKLFELGVQVSLFPIGNVEVDNDVELASIKLALENAKTFDTYAPSVKIWHQHDMATRIGSGTHYGWPIFELDTFTPNEKHQLNSIKVINCSKWAQSVCTDNEVSTTCGIVPLGYNPDIFYPKAKKKGPTFKVFNMGKWEIRKGHDILPAIFSSAFTKEDDVELVMACTNPFYTEQENREWEAYYAKSLAGYKVSFLPKQATSQDVANFMRGCDCGLFPSRAEGWNLEALESLACGVPVVATHYSAHNEFMEDIYGENYRLEPAIDGKWFFGQGNWLEINDHNRVFDGLVYDLRRVYAAYKDGLLEDRQNLAENFTWLNSAKKLCEVTGV